MSDSPEPNPGVHRLQLRLPAHHLAVRLARARVRDCAGEAGIAQDEVERLEFVTGELLTNAVDHGGGQGAMDEEQWAHGVHMHLELECTSAGWSLRVEDEGGGDPESLRHMLVSTDEVPDLEDERGRGFFLLMAMLDSLQVESGQARRWHRLDRDRANRLKGCGLPFAACDSSHVERPAIPAFGSASTPLVGDRFAGGGTSLAASAKGPRVDSARPVGGRNLEHVDPNDFPRVAPRRLVRLAWQWAPRFRIRGLGNPGLALVAAAWGLGRLARQSAPLVGAGLLGLRLDR